MSVKPTSPQFCYATESRVIIVKEKKVYVKVWPRTCSSLSCLSNHYNVTVKAKCLGPRGNRRRRIIFMITVFTVTEKEIALAAWCCHKMRVTIKRCLTITTTQYHWSLRACCKLYILVQCPCDLLFSFLLLGVVVFDHSKHRERKNLINRWWWWCL